MTTAAYRSELQGICRIKEIPPADVNDPHESCSFSAEVVPRPDEPTAVSCSRLVYELTVCISTGLHTIRQGIIETQSDLRYSARQPVLYAFISAFLICFEYFVWIRRILFCVYEHRQSSHTSYIRECDPAAKTMEFFSPPTGFFQGPASHDHPFRPCVREVHTGQGRPGCSLLKARKTAEVKLTGSCDIHSVSTLLVSFVMYKRRKY